MRQSTSSKLKIIFQPPLNIKLVYLTINIRNNLICNVKRTAVYFIVEDFSTLKEDRTTWTSARCNLVFEIAIDRENRYNEIPSKNFACCGAMADIPAIIILRRSIEARSLRVFDSSKILIFWISSFRRYKPRKQKSVCCVAKTRRSARLAAMAYKLLI